MADKGFGIKELNLIGDAGVPTIESPNNLNLNAVNVAISTDVSVGDTLKVGTGVTVHAGVITATSFVGTASTATAAATAYALDSSVTIGTATTATYAGSWVLGANGSSDYTFTGDGLTGTVNDPDLTLIRGQKYIFKNRSGGHPFRIQTTYQDTSGTAYNTGVTNNSGGNGTDIIFEVPQDAPGTLYYQCTAHTNMSGKLNIAGTSSSEIDTLNANIAILGFKVAVNGSLTKYNLVDQVIDEYADSSGIDAGASTNEAVSGSGAGKYYYGSDATGGSTTYNQTYNYSGSDTTISIDSGATVSGTVKVWGAAGGQDSNSSGSNHYGGGGAFASGVLSYTSDGTDLILSVGQGGLKGQKGGSAGNGGGYSGIFLGSKTHANTLILAGGGGGAGDAGGAHGGVGGAFGGTAGQGGGGAPGDGGQQGTGGGRGNGGGSVPSTDGSALTGGHGGANEARQQSASYNGGGIQGQEPGGYMGGGGGGGGYYGGGGGGGGNNGDGGGGGSSYYNTGSYWTGTPSSEAGDDENAGGDDDANYTSGVGKGGTASGGGSTSGGNGAIYLNISVSSATAGDLTLQSTDTTASSAPTKADMVMLIEDGAGTATLNTDIKGYISRDSGTTFTQGTLVDEGTWGTNKKVVAFHNLDISGQPSGTAMCYKITTHNQNQGSKETYIHATSMGWS